jgi:hypothetical protein
MPKYEFWGDDDSGKNILLGYMNGDLPDKGDTIVVRGQVREVEKVWRHHVGTQITQRVGVGKSLGDAEK